MVPSGSGPALAEAAVAVFFCHVHTILSNAGLQAAPGDDEMEEIEVEEIEESGLVKAAEFLLVVSNVWMHSNKPFTGK